MVKVNYKISSRAAILLGRENVSKADGAIIELVKNSYDADASECCVVFDIVNDSIFIIDNGHGMDESDLINKWLTIGTDNKRTDFTTKSNRIKSGEKGIGRLALDRLGNKYTLYTKKLNKVYSLSTIWSDFEKSGYNLDDINIDIVEEPSAFDRLGKLEILKDLNISKYLHGTIIHITELRDNWTKAEVNSIYRMLGYLLPPVEQKSFVVYYKDSYSNEKSVIEPSINKDYDYRIKAIFDGEIFTIDLYRNEFDINRLPNELFMTEEFSKYPYRKCDFESGHFCIRKTISELLNSDNEEKINRAKDIGAFEFNYIFMKLQLADKDYQRFYYKNISPNRKDWIKDNCGLKIYRDGFMVRPYGDVYSSDAFDWLGLDARKANSPAAISHPSMGWKVRNSQSQGTLLISRINNDKILDKSSREGIIDNQYFLVLKELLRNIISEFEMDRAYIAKYLKIYNDKVNEKESIKKEGKQLAEKVLKNGVSIITEEESEKLAKAVNYYKEESEELITEIKLLRSLSTNGLITTSVVHDLKTMNAVLIKRVGYIKDAIDENDFDMLETCLSSLKKSDEFLHSWITVLISQVKSDRRKRRKVSLSKVVYDLVANLKPILDEKKVTVNIRKNFDEICKKIFIVDFETVFYNLIINSIESFEHSKCVKREINIELLYSNDNFEVIYSDNGNGLGNKFSNPYDIFNFGVTSKYDKNGEKNGTGLGMYILSTTISEYNGKYELMEFKNSFKLKISIPFSGELI